MALPPHHCHLCLRYLLFQLQKYSLQPEQIGNRFPLLSQFQELVLRFFTPDYLEDFDEDFDDDYDDYDDDDDFFDDEEEEEEKDTEE